MRNRLLQKVLFLFCIFLLVFVQKSNCQTTINAGETSGVWSAKGSPYRIKGDINIPVEKTLVIEPGVKVEFEGHYKINVQGSLYAKGTEKDSIVFITVKSTGKNIANTGWNGIRFDRRPVEWDTIKFRMPANELFKQMVLEKVKTGELDTSTRIKLALAIPDLVNDTLLPDSLFTAPQGSCLSYCRFENGRGFDAETPYVFGGAVYIYRYSNLLIENCVFKNNTAYAGGALYCKEADPVLSCNTFKNNSAESSGGALVFIYSGAMLVNNTIDGNTSAYNGGAILLYESNPCVLNNTIIRNTALNSGGGIYCEKEVNGSSLSGHYVTQYNKFSRSSEFEKANLKDKNIKPVLVPYGQYTNNIICSNTAKTGGAIGLSATAPEFVNNTISNNSAKESGGALYCFASSPKIINTIIYSNTSKTKNSQLHFYGKNKPVLSYCDIEAGKNGFTQDSISDFSSTYEYNMNSGPLFKNPALMDYSLTDNSPCIDAGTPVIKELSLTSSDLKGNTRIANGIVDIGALEYKKTSSKKTTADELKSSGNSEGAGETGREEEVLVNLYPNPNKGIFSINIRNSTAGNALVSIYDQNGKMMYNKDYNTGNRFDERINLYGCASGTYIVVIQSAGQVVYNGEIVIE